MADHVLGDDDAGSKLDRVVARYHGVSRRIARLLIRAGDVSLNGRTLRIFSKEVRAGQCLSVRGDSAVPKELPRVELRIIAVERDYVVVDKPAGLLSETDRHGGPSVETILPSLLRAENARVESLTLVHRLDAGTSGVMVLGRTRKGVRDLNAAFREGRVRKIYRLLATGRLQGSQRVEVPIGRLKGTKHGVRTDGKPSLTEVFSLANNGQASYVEARPHTGRTHQIRVHLAHLGHPLLGDRLYGGRGYSVGSRPEPIPRAMLHARTIEFPIPGGDEQRRYAAALADDFRHCALQHGLSIDDASL